MSLVLVSPPICTSLVALVVSDSVTPWTLARQVPLHMGFSRQEYWSGLPCSPGDPPDPGIEPMSPLCLLHCRWILTEPPGKSPHI